jgi:hypothetical protein
VYAAYGTVILHYVMTGSTILSMGLWLMSYNITWMFMVLGYEILFPWLVVFQYDINHSPIDKIVLPVIT